MLDCILDIVCSNCQSELPEVSLALLVFAAQELDGGREVPAEQPHDEPLLRHLQLGEAGGDGDVPGCLHYPDRSLCLAVQTEAVELPVIEPGLGGTAGLQDVAAAHCGAQTGPRPGLRLYLQSGADNRFSLYSLHTQLRISTRPPVTQHTIILS